MVAVLDVTLEPTDWASRLGIALAITPTAAVRRSLPLAISAIVSRIQINRS